RGAGGDPGARRRRGGDPGGVGQGAGRGAREPPVRGAAGRAGDPSQVRAEGQAGAGRANPDRDRGPVEGAGVMMNMAGEELNEAQVKLVEAYRQLAHVLM